MSNELLYQVALTHIPHIGPVQAKILLQHCNVEEIFHAKKTYLEKIEGIGPVRAASVTAFRDFSKAEKEITFMEKYRIRPLFITDEAYPKRLLNCYDSPTLLYYKGEADLNAPRMAAIVGTRSHTEYARQVTERITRELAAHRVTVVSGLAYGVDALAHKASLKNGLPTVGVLAHGLDQVYPPDHAGMAKDMIREGGGLLTEFGCGTKPDKHNFPTRNRVVAGMSDLVIVIETGMRGGSMITAEMANGYNRDVFAVPGKITDPKSAGCNELVKNNKAFLLSDPADLAEVMGWAEKKKATPKKQKELFIELSPEEKVIVSLLQQKDLVHIDEISLSGGLSSSVVAAAILNLELQNVILSLPGKLYRLA